MKNLTSKLLLLLLVGLMACAPQAAVPYHEGLQKEATFENRLGNVESFTLKSLRDDEKELKKKLKELQKLKAEHAKMDALELRLAGLRALIRELENQ